MKDLYSVLGVATTASADDIKRAYRRLASQHHPDKGGDKTRFQEIQEAYSVLGDAAKRQQYDNPAPAFQSAGSFDFDSIFQMFGTRFGEPRPAASTARIQLWIGLADVITGGLRNIAISSPAGQQHIEITIPAGIQDGASVRYPRLAPGGLDLVINFRVRPEPGWHRQDNDLVHDMSVSVWDLMLGADVNMTTLAGRSLTVAIPPLTQSGALLRVRGHGVPNRTSGTPGDLLLRISAQMPTSISQELEDLVRKERGH